MGKIVLLVAVITIGLLLWYKIKSSSGDARRKLIIKTVIGLVLATLAILAITGKLSVLTAIIGGIIALIPKVAGYLRYVPAISKLYSSAKQQGQAQQQQAAASNGDMSRDEALKILGLQDGASKEDILTAHKRMMQKMHPDRGGSDHLASQINKAKDTLLG